MDAPKENEISETTPESSKTLTLPFQKLSYLSPTKWPTLKQKE